MFNRNGVMHVFMLLPGVPSSPTNIILSVIAVNSLRVEWFSDSESTSINISKLVLKEKTLKLYCYSDY